MQFLMHHYKKTSLSLASENPVCQRTLVTGTQQHQQIYPTCSSLCQYCVTGLAKKTTNSRVMIASLKINLVSMKCFINPFFLLKVNITRLEFYTKQRELCECLQGFKCQGILAELPITNNRLMAAGSCCFAEARARCSRTCCCWWQTRFIVLKLWLFHKL